MLLVIAAGGWTALPTFAQAGAPPTTPPPITTIPSDGFNMKVVEQLTPYYVITTLDPPVFNWFAGTFTNLPTDKEVTIGLNMSGMDHIVNKADVSKWVGGLKPVMTYADPTKYESYEWFTKDNLGRWVSGDPFKTDNLKYAGTGTVPDQHVIPANIAEQFLSKDTKFWSPWRPVDSTEIISSLNILRIRQCFSMPTTTIAMHIPFPTALQQAIIERIQRAKVPGISVDEIGKTMDGNPIRVIRIAHGDDSYPVSKGIRHSSEGYDIPIFSNCSPSRLPRVPAPRILAARGILHEVT